MSKKKLATGRAIQKGTTAHQSLTAPDPGGAALVQLKNGQVLFGLAEKGGVGDEGRGQACGHVGAGAVAHKVVALV